MFDKVRRPREANAAARLARAVGRVFSALLLLWAAPWARAAALQTLAGHLPPAAARARAVRHLEGTNVLRLAMGLPLRNQAQLDQLLQDLYDPGSPHFRHFLEPGDFAEQFGPTPQDYQAVAAFAASNHLTVTAQHSNRLLLDVTGSVEDIERAFHLRLRVYAHPTEAREFFAPDAEPQLDSSVPMLHISGLDNYAPPRHMSHAVTAAMQAAQPAPQAGSGPSGNYAGKDFRAAYAPGVTNTGAGQSVGLLEFAGYFASDILQYESNYSLPNVPLSNVLLDGVKITDSDTGVETPLDIELVIAMAPGLAQVIVYYGTLGDDILSSMATANAAKQISSSWTFGNDAETLQLFQQLAAQGQTYFNASGDADAYLTSVASPTDDPYITCVGGTYLSTTGAGGAWTSETTWNRGGGVGSGGGISLTYAIPLWQQGLSMDASRGSVFMRNIPDVAMVADNMWILFNNGGSGAYGGTSCSSPLWAGFMALVNQQALSNGQPPVGFLNPAIYALGKSANYTPAFHDITSGNNALPASPNKYYAVTGYDLCTGWGSPNGQSFINALALSAFNPMAVTPTNGLAVAGPQGGPLIPTTGIFTLANGGGSSLGWSVANTSSWFTVSPSSGFLASSATANVTVTVAAAATNLAAGYYTASLLFTNKTNSMVLSRPVTLAVGTGLVWDSGASGGAAQDGGGVWADAASGNGSTNWYDGMTDHFWNNANPDFAIFGAGSGAAGTVTLGSAVTAAGINFATPGSGNYNIAGGGNTLTLNGNIIASTSATISAPVFLGEPGEFSVASGQTLTLSGVLSGASGNNLTVVGPGTVNLTGQNNASLSNGLAGAVTVSSGTLSLNAGGSSYGILGNAAGITISAGATLTLLGSNDISGTNGIPQHITLNGGTLSDAGLNQTVGSLTLNGGTISGTGSSTAGSFRLNGDCIVNANTTIAAQNITTTSGAAFYVNGADTLTITGTLIGAGGLNFAGQGKLILTGSNTCAGPTTNNSATLQLGNGGAGGGLGAGPVANTGLLEFNRSDDFSWPNAVSDPGNSGTFVKINSNTVTLLGANSFLSASGGSAQVNGGTLQINAPALLVCGASFWVGQNSTAAAIMNGGTLVVSNGLAVGRNSSSASGTLTLNGGLIQKNTASGNIIVGAAGGTGVMTVNGGTISNASAIYLGENSTGRGTLNLNGGLVQAAQITRSTSRGASALLNFNGGTLLAATNQTNFLAIDQANVLGGNAIIDDSSNSVVVNQALVDGGGGGGLVKNGAGTLTLTATNTYTGATVVNLGTLKVMTSNQVPSHAVLPPTTALTLAAGATLDLSKLSETIGSLAGSAGCSVLLGAGTNSSALTFGNSVNTTFSGVISGNGSVTKNGGGTVVFSGVNTFNGPTFINAGTVTFGQTTHATGQLPASSPLSLAAAATLDLAGTTQSFASLSDAGGGGGRVTNSSGAPALLLLSSPNATTNTFSGQFNDASAASAVTLYLYGNGTQIFNGASACSGPTTILSGTLLVNGSLGTNAITVNGGALGGVGVIAGPASIQSGGTLLTSPGAIGALNFDAGLALNDGSTNLMKINKAVPTNDQVVVAGNLNYGGTLVLTNLGGTLAAGDSFPLFNATSYTGSFAILSPGIPGPGLIWNTSTLTNDGTLRIMAASLPEFASFTISGPNFILSASGGTPGGSYRVVTSTDVTLPLTNWTPLWTNTFDANGNGPTLSNPINPAIPQQFFDIVVP